MKTIREAKEFPTNVPVYLFGAGKGGQILYRAVRRRPDVKIVGFIDNSRNTTTIDGINVLDVETFLKEKTDDAVVVISSQYFREIALQLMAVNFRGFYNGYPYILHLMDQDLLMKGRLLWAMILVAITAIAWWGLS